MIERTEHELIGCFEDAHRALVEAAKIAHLAKHPEAQAISKLVDSLEEIVGRVWDQLKNSSTLE